MVDVMDGDVPAPEEGRESGNGAVPLDEAVPDDAQPLEGDTAGLSGYDLGEGADDPEPTEDDDAA